MKLYITVTLIVGIYEEWGGLHRKMRKDPKEWTDWLKEVKILKDASIWLCLSTTDYTVCGVYVCNVIISEAPLRVLTKPFFIFSQWEAKPPEFWGLCSFFWKGSGRIMLLSGHGLSDCRAQFSGKSKSEKIWIPKGMIRRDEFLRYHWNLISSFNLRAWNIQRIKILAEVW